MMMSLVLSSAMSVLGAGDSEGLRHVERDVLIPKKMREKAMKLCADYVKGQFPSFTGIICDCLSDRTCCSDGCMLHGVAT